MISGLRNRALVLERRVSERIEIERILAAARVVLAISSVVATCLIPEPFPRPHLVNVLLLLYLANATALLGTLWLRSEMDYRIPWMAHAVDLIWAMLITFFTNGPNSAFFMFFLLAIVSAAFRWNMREVLITTTAAVTAIVAETILLSSDYARGFGEHVDVPRFALRTLFLVIFGVLIGYLAESEKWRRAEALNVAQIPSKARVDIGLKASVQATLQEILDLFGGRGLLLASHDARAGQGYLWRLERAGEDQKTVFSGRLLPKEEQARYFFALPEECAAAAWRKGPLSAVAVDITGKRVHTDRCRVGEDFSLQHPHDLLLLGTVPMTPATAVRVFLFEPALSGPLQRQLQLLQELMNSAAPAVHNVYLLRRLRSRAAAVERVRVARELHDGVVQSLHAIAFRLYALRTAKDIGAIERNEELTQIQELVQSETTNLRALIRQLEPLDFDPRHLADFLSRMTEQFRYDTGIGAKFVCDPPELTLPPRTCRELAGIVQEALANVLKHSGAQNVLVRLGIQNGAGMLTIQDDGRGFEFSGRMSYSELRNSRRGPLVIKERVRGIGGELTIESTPGQGSRLEIQFPRQAESHLV
ncbi:MAG TPA: sensor histidine kinase [Candidatus Sulfotelmatobacter sp.]|nr:sensor histidine kinase [Candidatus Sulfotelmatobacter sp.]